jgi:hypothetical protein
LGEIEGGGYFFYTLYFWIKISLISLKSHLIARDVSKDERRILTFSLTQAFRPSILSEIRVLATAKADFSRLKQENTSIMI